ncbi:MAG: methyl-accepting chemotaxis protein, partial [Pseudomonadota bacterium]
DEAVARLEEVGPRMRAQLSTIVGLLAASDSVAEAVVKARAQESLLLGRLYVRRYLLDNDPDDGDRAISELLSAMNGINQVDVSGDPSVAADVNLVRNDVRTYLGDAQRLIELIEQRNRLRVEVLDQRGSAISSAAERLERTAQTRLAALSDETTLGLRSSADLGLALSITVAIAANILAFLVARSVTRPLKALTGAMTAIAQDDLLVEPPGVDRPDELGAMARTLDVFRSNAVEKKRLTDEQDALRADAAAQRKQEAASLADALSTSIGDATGTLTEASDGVRGGAQSIAGMIRANANRSAEAADGVRLATTNVEAVAAAADELIASIQEIGRQAARSTEIVNEAVVVADRSRSQVDDLNRAAANIGDVAKLIAEIAEQTNLLALNATIEAARAGEAGRGFAVVAGEVKSLASQTGKATDDITRRIDEVRAATGRTAEDMVAIREVIGRVSEIANAIAAGVEEQNAATREIAARAQDAAGGAGQIGAQIEAIRESAESNGRSAEEMLSSAERLATLSAKLDADVDDFVTRVRAA